MMKADNIVLKLGERGAFAYDGKFYRIVPSFRVKAVDTTGAGDVFTSALALRTLAETISILRAHMRARRGRSAPSGAARMHRPTQRCALL